jgi:hypothetical protein
MAAGVAERSKTVKAMLKRSQAVADLHAGGDAMRAAGEQYLPKFPVETPEDYQARLKSTWLFNGIEKQIDDTTGRIFAKPIVLADPDSPLSDWAGNIDMEGRDLSNFAKDVFEASMLRGMSFIMADAPPKESGQTVAAVQASGWRPFLVSLPLEQVLGWKWESVNGTPVLTQFRIMESVAEPGRDEFSDAVVEQVRVLDLVDGAVRIRLYRENAKGEWVVHSEYGTDFEQIYVTPMYTGRKGYLIAKTRLTSIAELNLAHWRVQSDKSNCLHKSLSPLLHLRQMGSIGKDGEDIYNSAGYGFLSDGDNSHMEWVEVTGAGIGAAGDELAEIKDQMKQSGLQIISEKVGVSTATGDSIDEAKSVTRIRMWADDLKDALEIALGWVADIAGIDNSDGQASEVVVNKDFGMLAGMAMSDIKDMYLAGAISRATYINEAKRRGVIDEAITADDEKERIEDEGLGGEL